MSKPIKLCLVLLALALIPFKGYANSPIGDSSHKPPILTTTAIDRQSMLETVKMFTKAGDSAYQLSASNLLDELAVHSTVLREGRDEDLRPLFVNVQADFERAIVYWLKNKYIEECTCIIHTPAPATPLCTNGEISTGLVDPVIASDPQRLLTVKKRPDIIREYLDEGGHLLAVYPQKGRALRSVQQLTVFDDLLQKYPLFKNYS